MSTLLAEDADPVCPRCQCCEMVWEDCEHCGGEGSTEPGELYEQDPLWYDEEDVEPCEICLGKGGWLVCIGGCDAGGKHRAEEKNP